MICKKSISAFIVRAKCCSVDIANDYALQFTYGTPEAEGLMDKLVLLRCLIRSLENYVVVTADDFIQAGVKYLSGEKIILSPKNPLSLESAETKIQVTSEDVNCSSEEDLCIIVNKIKALCPGC